MQKAERAAIDARLAPWLAGPLAPYSVRGARRIDARVIAHLAEQLETVTAQRDHARAYAAWWRDNALSDWDAGWSGAPSPVTASDGWSAPPEEESGLDFAIRQWAGWDAIKEEVGRD